MAAMARSAAPVREPTADELQSFQTIADVMIWAKVKGNPLVNYTQAGALMEAIAGDEFETMTVAEFASISRRISRQHCRNGNSANGKTTTSPALLPATSCRTR